VTVAGRAGLVFGRVPKKLSYLVQIALVGLAIVAFFIPILGWPFAIGFALAAIAVDRIRKKFA
jgi:inner membrane protein involved in colicin E2 resistance